MSNCLEKFKVHRLESLCYLFDNLQVSLRLMSDC